MKIRVHQLDTEGLPDGDYVVEVVDGVATLAEGAADVVAVPLTTEINGVPDFVWDNNNNLIFTEAP